MLIQAHLTIIFSGVGDGTTTALTGYTYGAVAR